MDFEKILKIIELYKTKYHKKIIICSVSIVILTISLFISIVYSYNKAISEYKTNNIVNAYKSMHYVYSLLPYYKNTKTMYDEILYYYNCYNAEIATSKKNYDLAIEYYNNAKTTKYINVIYELLPLTDSKMKNVMYLKNYELYKNYIDSNQIEEALNVLTIAKNNYVESYESFQKFNKEIEKFNGVKDSPNNIKINDNYSINEKTYKETLASLNQLIEKTKQDIEKTDFCNKIPNEVKNNCMFEGKNNYDNQYCKDNEENIIKFYDVYKCGKIDPKRKSSKYFHGDSKYFWLSVNALSMHEKATKENNIKNKIKYYEKFIEYEKQKILEKENNKEDKNTSDWWINNLYSFLGRYYLEDNENDKALACFKKAKSIYKKGKDLVLWPEWVGDAYFQQGKYRESNAYYQEALESVNLFFNQGVPLPTGEKMSYGDIQIYCNSGYTDLTLGAETHKDICDKYLNVLMNKNKKRYKADVERIEAKIVSEETIEMVPYTDYD